VLSHVHPATVLEIVTSTGGTAIWMADMLLFDVDVSLLENRMKEIKADNVTFLQGDS